MTAKTAAFTLAAWANIPTTSEKGCLAHIGKADGSDGFSLGIGNTSFDTAGNNLIFEACPNQWTVLGTAGIGWHHLAAVVDSLGGVTGTVDGHAAEIAVPMPASAADYVALQRGAFIHLSLATFVGTEFVAASTPADTFAPTGPLDIAQWIDVVKAFGAKYVHLTIKHLDGFCLWPTTTTTHGIANTTWYATHGNPDITQIFCDTCRAKNVLPCFYFSIADTNWASIHPGYTNAEYKSFTEGQITEVLTRYGPVAAIWLDSTEVFFAGAKTPWATSAERAAFIHGVQPGILIVNNAHTGTLADSDVVEYEESLPPSGGTDPAESCYTIASSWFWESDTQTLVNPGTMGDRIRFCNANNAAILINVPPNTSGIIPAQFITMLDQTRKYLGELPRQSPNNMTSDNAPSPYVASASTEYPGQGAFKAFNGPAGSFWSSNAGSLPANIQIDLSTSKTVSSYSVQSRAGGNFGQWLAWTLMGSANGSTWTTVDTRTQALINPGEVRFYNLTTAATWRYWRWNITSTNTGTDADCGNLALFP